MPAAGRDLAARRRSDPISSRSTMLLNCRSRRSLQWAYNTACEAYRHLPRHRYKQRQRHATFCVDTDPRKRQHTTTGED